VEKVNAKKIGLMSVRFLARLDLLSLHLEV